MLTEDSGTVGTNSYSTALINMCNNSMHKYQQSKEFCIKDNVCIVLKMKIEGVSVIGRRYIHCCFEEIVLERGSQAHSEKTYNSYIPTLTYHIDGDPPDTR